MGEHSSKALRIFAPAKINLFLHITGKRSNGYHELQSLASFADIGDIVTLSPADNVQFTVSGPFANGFEAKELDSSPESKNIMMKALWGLSRLYSRIPKFHVHLEKNLPLAAGIGGGSADAAALIWGIVKQWGPPQNKDAFEDFMLQLGADVPVCYASRDAMIGGIGEQIDPVEQIADMPALLINPLKICPTDGVFKTWDGQFHAPATLPANCDNLATFTEFLKKQSNDLQKPAEVIVPDITNILNALQYSEGCLVARMSGSGATCFGIFENEEQTRKAHDTIMSENPDWWVKSGTMGGAARY